MSPIAFYIATSVLEMCYACPTKWESVNTKGQTDRQRRVKCFVLQFFSPQIVLFLKCWQILKAYRGMLHFQDITIAQGTVKTKRTNNNHIWVTSSGKHSFFFVFVFKRKHFSTHTNREWTSLIRTWLHSCCGGRGGGGLLSGLDGSQAHSPVARYIARYLVEEKSETLLRQIHYLTLYSHSQCY